MSYVSYWLYSLGEFNSLGGLGEGESEFKVSIEVFDFSVTDVNSFDGGDFKTSSQCLVDSINVGWDEGGKFFSEGSSFNSEGGALDGDGSEIPWINFSKDLSTIVGNVTNNAGSVILSNEGIFSFNDESDNVWSLEGSVFSSESELRDILGELDLDSNGDVATVLGGKFWDGSTELISGDLNAEEAQVWGKVNLFLSLESGEEEWVDTVVSQDILEVLSSFISFWDGDWGKGNGNWYIGVEEGSVDCSSNVSLWWDNWSAGKGIVKSKRGASESFLGSPLSEILVNVGVDDGWEISLELLNNLVWDEVLDHWFDKISNLGNTWTFKINGDIVLVDNEFNISAFNCGS